MNIKRNYSYGLPVLLLPVLAAAAVLWPVQPAQTGIPEPVAAPVQSAGSHYLPTFMNGSKQQEDVQFAAGKFSPVEEINRPAAFAGASEPHLSYQGDRKTGGQIITKDGRVFPLRPYKSLISPNDPSAYQWWVAPNGMPQAWELPAGAKTSKIAIIDTGFALNHQEFTGRWAVNTGETNNGIDDDGNGLVDDVTGWDFVNFDKSVQAGETNPNGSGTTHGTMVAGVAAATGNNGIGIAGVNWYSTILPIQALNDDDSGDSFTVGQSIYYAADQGADVISISLGTQFDDSYMREAVRYALSKGSVVVAAAGNDGCDCMLYPARYPEVIAVGASKPDGNTASFSSYGTSLDIIAPGQSMTSSTWTAADGTSAYASNLAGTSFSAPFVSGLLALGRSYQPDANWLEISGAMFEKADKRTLNAAAPHNNQIGYGYTRASIMLDRLRVPHHSVQRYSFSPLSSESGRAYQCGQNDIPSTLLYELSNSTRLRYTASPAVQLQAAAQGLATSASFYGCIGLPTDTIEYSRVINMAQETKNRQIKQ